MSRKHAARIAKACAAVEGFDETPKLQDLAAVAGMSAYHFHRLFVKFTGLTPRAYCEAHRARRIRVALSSGEERIIDAIFSSGFSSSSRFYEKSSKLIGMSPKQFKNGGEGTAIVFACSGNELGRTVVARTDKGVCFIETGRIEEELLRGIRLQFHSAAVLSHSPDFEAFLSRRAARFDGESVGGALPPALRSIVFAHWLWHELSQAHVPAKGRPARGALGVERGTLGFERVTPRSLAPALRI